MALTRGDMSPQWLENKVPGSLSVTRSTTWNAFKVENVPSNSLVSNQRGLKQRTITQARDDREKIKKHCSRWFKFSRLPNFSP